MISPEGTTYHHFGLTKPGGTEVNEQTVYEIGSISKTFTALLLSIAVDEGKVKLNDPISQYIEHPPKEMSEPITLAHLSDHTSGLPRMPANFRPADPLNPYVDYTKQHMLEFIQYHTMRRDVGAEYEYSNLAQGLLGSILEDVYGMTYEELVIEKIAKPMGMQKTRVTFNDEMKSNLALPFNNGQQVKNWDIPALAGAGAIRSSTADMVKYVKASLGLQEYQDNNSLARTHQPRHDKAPGDLSVGLGWHIRHGENGDIIWHNGGTGGYRAFAGFHPDSRRGVVVLTNCTVSVDDLGINLLDSSSRLNHLKPKITFLIAREIEEKGIEAALESFRNEKAESADEWDFNEMDINTLGYEYLEKEKFDIAKAIFKLNMSEYPESGNVYDSYAEVLMESGDNEGAIEYYKKSVDIDPGNANGIAKLKELGVEYQPKEIVVETVILEKYIGKYELAPSFFMNITLENGQLMAQATGQMKLPLFPKSQTAFYMKIAPISIEFVEEEGEVSRLILFQGGQEVNGRRVEE